MKLWDISPTIGPGFPVFPGDTPFDARWTARIGPNCPVNVSAFSTTPHIGSHTDAPLHYDDAGAAIADVALDIYLGPCRVIHAFDAGTHVTPAHVGLGEPAQLLQPRPQLGLQQRLEVVRRAGHQEVPGHVRVHALVRQPLAPLPGLGVARLERGQQPQVVLRRRRCFRSAVIDELVLFRQRRRKKRQAAPIANQSLLSRTAQRKVDLLHSDAAAQLGCDFSQHLPRELRAVRSPRRLLADLVATAPLALGRQHRLLEQGQLAVQLLQDLQRPRPAAAGELVRLALHPADPSRKGRLEPLGQAAQARLIMTASREGLDRVAAVPAGSRHACLRVALVLERALDHHQQRRELDRLGEELFCALLDRPDREVDRAMRREDDDRGGRILVLEPLAGRAVPWWDAWSEAFLGAGGREDLWRVPARLPEISERLGRAAGLDPTERTARSLALGALS